MTVSIGLGKVTNLTNLTNRSFLEAEMRKFIVTEEGWALDAKQVAIVDVDHDGVYRALTRNRRFLGKMNYEAVCTLIGKGNADALKPR